MTAIASAFTSEGFVIGADGRQLDKDKKIFTESSQKIFNITNLHVHVAYAWCGKTSVVNESNEVCQAQQFRPDVILMDIGLPKLNGLDAARQICELVSSTLGRIGIRRLFS
jgi:CheY-like chemotaxis protein